MQTGIKMPIAVDLKLDQPTRVFTVFRNDKPYVEFNFPGQATDQLRILVYGPADMAVEINGYETRGRPQ